jgi:hypothetical protein
MLYADVRLSSPYQLVHYQFSRGGGSLLTRTFTVEWSTPAWRSRIYSTVFPHEPRPFSMVTSLIRLTIARMYRMESFSLCCITSVPKLTWRLSRFCNCSFKRRCPRSPCALGIYLQAGRTVIRLRASVIYRSSTKNGDKSGSDDLLCHQGTETHFRREGNEISLRGCLWRRVVLRAIQR